MRKPGSEHSVQYRPDIDGLRAVAVLLVVAFHAFPAWMPGGFIGVDVFFVISGYLITSILLKDLGNDKYTLIGFYARRFRRIAPALLVVLLATWGCGWFVLLGGEFSSLGRHIAAGAGFMANLLLRFESGYFDVAADFKPLLHLWSLGVEEQFYLIWPLMLAFSYRRGLNVTGLVLLLLLVSFVLNVTYVETQPATTFYFLHTRFWELLLGGALACLEILDERHLGRWLYTRTGSWFGGDASLLRTRFSPYVAAAGLLLLIAGAAFINERKPFPGWWASLPTCGAALLIAAGPNHWLARLALSRRPVVLIGLISYPLYLWHWPLLSFAAIMEEGHVNRNIRICAVVISLLLAYATWRGVELPAQRKLFSSRPARQRARLYVGFGLASLFIVGLLGVFTMYRKGFPTRHPADEAIAAQMQWNSDGATRCRDRYGLSGICWATRADPEVAIWGESHAEMLLPGLTTTPDRSSSSFVVVGNYGCPPLLGVEIYYGHARQDCEPKTEQIRASMATRMSSVKTVVLVSRGPVYFSGHGFGEEESSHDPLPVLVSSVGAERAASQAEIFMEGYSRTISFIESTGKSAVFFMDVPEIGFDPAECVDVRPIRFTQKKRRDPCTVAAAQVHARQAEYRAIVVELQRRHPRMRVFDSVPFLCDAQTCHVMIDGKVIYRDDDHLSAVGSRYIAGPLFEFLHRPAKTAVSENMPSARNEADPCTAGRGGSPRCPRS